MRNIALGRGTSRGRRNRWRVFAAAAMALAATACSTGGTSSILTAPLPLAGSQLSASYSIANVGGAITTDITLQGMGSTSPQQISNTVFASGGATTTTETEWATAPNGQQAQALGMNRVEQDFGLDRTLLAQITTYDQRDQFGNHACGAKVKMTWQPNIVEALFHAGDRNGWSAEWYYTVPCSAPAIAQPTASPLTPQSSGSTASARATASAGASKSATLPTTVPLTHLDLPHAKLISVVIDQQFTPRILFGQPITSNGGHSVTIVGGAPSRFVGGWWNNNTSILAAANLTVRMVQSLNQHQWLSFGGQFDGAGLVLSAGDADTYLTLKRLFLNQQSDYLVNVRSAPYLPWRHLLVHPEYNTGWNNLPADWKALTNTKFPALSDLVDTNTGQPKSLDLSDQSLQQLRQIEAAGCQNCPNPELSQIQLINADTHQPLYALTIRGWLGGDRSLFLFGQLPGSASSYLNEASQRVGQSNTSCPIIRDSFGNPKPNDQQYSAAECAGLLQNGSLWNMMIGNPASFGADVVGQFKVADTSVYTQHCDGSGDSVSCTYSIAVPHFNASYLFNTGGPKLTKAWTIFQLLGEFGMQALGQSYAAGPDEGNGLIYMMAQSVAINGYYSGVTGPNYNPENVFALDARALQTPRTIGAALADLGMN